MVSRLFGILCERWTTRVSVEQRRIVWHPEAHLHFMRNPVSASRRSSLGYQRRVIRSPELRLRYIPNVVSTSIRLASRRLASDCQRGVVWRLEARWRPKAQLLLQMYAASCNTLCAFCSILQQREQNIHVCPVAHKKRHRKLLSND